MQKQTHYYELTASKFDWKLSETKTVHAWGFNQSVPGPVLRAKKGDTMVIKVNNELDEPTVVHWHGIRLPASMDGTGEVQKPIEPGESFTYRFELPDAGSFWYHSHHNETVQMEKVLSFVQLPSSIYQKAKARGVSLRRTLDGRCFLPAP